MSHDYAHLAPTAAALLDFPKAERLEAIYEDRWITFPRARFALEVLETLLTRPRTTRMTSIAVYADSGMGKTMLMERFKRAHPPVYDSNEHRMVAPVLALQMASPATERRFYGQLLTSIGVPFAPRATVLDLEVQALRNLRRMDVKVLMLDEVHNILAGNAREQQIVLNMLRYLSNELRISLVCLGISEAREAIGGDVQLARRFEELILPRWQNLMSSLGNPMLDRCNPAREYSDWFSGLMPAARRGAARLGAFARRPFSVTLSPVAVLSLLSKPLTPGWPDDDGSFQYRSHLVADLFVPGLSELTREEGNFVPDVWTAKNPVRLVTARTILLAGLSHFLADPAASFRRVRDAGGGRAAPFSNAGSVRFRYTPDPLS